MPLFEVLPERVVIKTLGMMDDMSSIDHKMLDTVGDMSSIKYEREVRDALKARNGGELFDGIVALVDLPVRVPFIVMRNCGVDLDRVDLTNDAIRGAVENAFSPFEELLRRIHGVGYVVLDLWTSNILVETIGQKPLKVKLWLVDLESMLPQGAQCSGTPQKRVANWLPKTAEYDDDWKRWDLVKKFVAAKGLVPFSKCGEEVAPSVAEEKENTIN